jgi:hypothetical protein
VDVKRIFSRLPEIRIDETSGITPLVADPAALR